MRAKTLNFALRRFVRDRLIKNRGFGDIQESRDRLNTNAARFKPPETVKIEPWSQGPGRSEWVRPTKSEPRGTLLYLHGGGYVVCSPITHRTLTCYLAERLSANVLVPDYRLAPEHPFPAGLEDAVAAYDWLVSEGNDPTEIVIAGDSAGGGLTLATLLSLRDQSKPMPAAAALLSPYTDVTHSGASIDLNSDTDHFFRGDLIKEGGADYCGETPRTHPLVSPVFADFKGLPPLFIQVSKAECLLDDSTRVAARARAEGVNVTLDAWDGMPHVWNIFHRYIPEGKRANEDLAAFLRMHLGVAIVEEQRRSSASPILRAEEPKTQVA